MKTKTTKRFRIVLILYLIVLGVLCFADFGNIQEAPKDLFGIRFDRVVHFLMFLPFPAIAFLSIGRPGGAWRKAAAVFVIFVAGCILAAGTEIGQGMLPYRSKDIVDFYADIAALGTGSALTFAASLIFGKK